MANNLLTIAEEKRPTADCLPDPDVFAQIRAATEKVFVPG